ncbi:MAG TPA: VCBS repeat-containing protein, partial [Opitutus sp.]|nr:VCBS repeat-containing protein [Opitutus sp.]
MRKCSSLALAVLSCALIAPVNAAVSFKKLVLTEEYLADGISAGDFNRDGRKDIVAGPYWYAGPDFKTRQAFYPPLPQALEATPSNSLFSFVSDFNGDGWDDILVLGRVLHHQAFWYENPRDTGGEWKKHFAIHRVYGEAPPFVDIDGDGRPEVISFWEDRWGWWAPDYAEPTKPWIFQPITEPGKYREYYHGSGVGDINGDNRLDLVLNEGWWEQPAEKGQLWKHHPVQFSQGRGGAQILVYDIDGDGDNDVVSAIDAHGWGLSWFEQVRRNKDAREFVEHRMMGDRSEEAKFGVAFSQPHALCLGDIDGDGLTDVITGKRRWAHGPKGDVEP